MSITYPSEAQNLGTGSLQVPRQAKEEWHNHASQVAAELFYISSRIKMVLLQHGAP